MAQPLQKKSIWNKHFPTLLGLGVLIVALVGGIFLVGSSTDVFSPRATPETTPKNIQVSNHSDSGFTISFMTDSSVAGFIKYGTSPDDLSQQASDDRDQLTGTVGTFTTHHITLRGLQANTQYYYEVGTGSRNTFDNNGEPFNIQTFSRSGTATAAQTAYGTILGRSGSPATGALVFIKAPGIQTMSSLVKDSGSWAVPLSNARRADGSYADLTGLTQLEIEVQGTTSSDKLTHRVSMDATQPVATLTFGQALATTGDAVTGMQADTDSSSSAAASLATESGTVTGATASGTRELDTTVLPDQTLPEVAAGGLGDVITAASGIIDLQALDEASASGEPSTPQILTTTPIITGVATPNTRVTITVHSDSQIEQDVITDANGNFILDLSELEQSLEPGEHTVTYSYIDPATGQEVTGTHTFYVSGSAVALAQATGTTGTSPTPSASSGPFGSGNPYPVGGVPTPTASTSATPVATISATPKATSSSGITYPATGSGIPVSGSTGTTMALLIGGLFFLLTGTWSYYLAQKASEEENQYLI